MSEEFKLFTKEVLWAAETSRSESGHIVTDNENSNSHLPSSVIKLNLRELQFSRKPANLFCFPLILAFQS